MAIEKFYMFDTEFSQIPICATNEKLDWETNCRI